MTQENLQRIEDIVDAYNEKDMDRFLGLHHEHFEGTGPDQPEPRRGLSELRTWIEQFFTGFSDGRWEIRRAFAIGNLVCAELLSRGTHDGPFPGADGNLVPPTGNTVEQKWCGVFEFQDGKAISVHIYLDLMTTAVQMGIVPTPEAASS